ncbi:MAG: polymer-forming cytoskeletal protein [Treponema sp.]|nr:polymer-forming cytoskeletal protein [Treponema sp.]
MADNESHPNITVFGTETEFEGELDFTDNLVITGAYHGTIKSGGNLEIAKTAVCTVDSITTDTIVISGQVAGNVKAPSRLEMKSGCKITGDVTTARLKIADKVDFCGQVTMLEEDSETPDIFALSPQEYKQILAKSVPGPEEAKEIEQDDTESKYSHNHL